jgi:hypothetical protein
MMDRVALSPRQFTIFALCSPHKRAPLSYKLHGSLLRTLALGSFFFLDVESKNLTQTVIASGLAESGRMVGHTSITLLIKECLKSILSGVLTGEKRGVHDRRREHCR